MRSTCAASLLGLASCWPQQAQTNSRPQGHMLVCSSYIRYTHVCCTYYVQIQAYAGAISKWAGQWYSPANVHVNCNCVCFYLYVCMIMIFLCQCTCKVQLGVFLSIGVYIWRGQPPNMCKLCLLLPCLFVTGKWECAFMFSPIFSGFPDSLRFSQVSYASASFFLLRLNSGWRQMGGPKATDACVFMPWRSKVKLNGHFKGGVENLAIGNVYP